MQQFFLKFFSHIKDSCKDAAQRMSSSRIQSYAMLILIYIFCIFFIVQEVIRCVKLGSWEMSTSIEQIFMAILTHHVASNAVTKNSKSEPRGEFKKEEEIKEEVKIDNNN